MKVILKILQVLIKATIIFILFFVWLKFYIPSIWQVACISLFFTIILTIILSSYQKSKSIKVMLKSKQKEEAELMFEILIKNQDKNFFYDLLKQRYKKIISHKDFFTIVTQENENVVLYPYLKVQSMDQDNLLDIINQLKKYKKQKIIICCNSYNKEVESLANQYEYKINLLDKYSTYQKLFKEYEFYPNIPSQKEKNSKTKLKEILNYSFSRAKAKSYFYSAIFLLAISFTINTNLYYCIVASILILFSLICIIKPNSNQNINEDLI